MLTFFTRVLNFVLTLVFTLVLPRVFTLVLIIVHGFITFGAARLLKLDVDIAAVASQANIGGAASALALSRSLGRSDLLLPAVLIGSLGIATGTFLGFWVAQTLLPGFFG